MVLMAPVVVSSVRPTGKAGRPGAVDSAIVEFVASASTPLTLSLARTLAIGVEAAPATAVPLSVAGMITGAKVLV